MKKKIYFMKMKKKIKNIKYYDFVSNLPNIPALFITKKIIEPFQFLTPSSRNGDREQNK